MQRKPVFDYYGLFQLGQRLAVVVHLHDPWFDDEATKRQVRRLESAVRRAESSDAAAATSAWIVC